ncbi:MAG: high frequency lysogenization protein HflD [Pseudomonadota bacterium]
MEGFLFLGFVIGMAHALEADHVAAVGAMATGRNTPKSLALRGAAWGLGHTITLFAICSAAILFGFVLTDQAAAALEFAVGIMLVVLGLDVIRRMRAARVHFHVHDHGDGRPHVHAHSHHGAKVSHASDPHDHSHHHAFPLKALGVGLIHGAAGSAGLLALAVAASKDAWLAVGYVALFGIGSILGMAALSFVAAWPLGAAERSATWLHRGVQLTAAVVAIGLGVHVMMETGHAALGTALTGAL